MRFWCQKVLPAVYDQSLSYYEALCRMGALLNKMVEQLKDMQDNIDALHKAFLKLQAWVNAEIERFESDMENRFAEFKQEIYDLFQQYKEEADTFIKQQLEKYKTETTNWLLQKFEEFKTQTNNYINEIFNNYKTETNQIFNQWKTDFTNQYNQWKQDVKQDITNLGDRVTNVEGDITNINNQIDNIKHIISTNFPKFEQETVVYTGSKYYQRMIIDFLSFPSTSDSKVLCYGICRTFGLASPASVSGSWRERFTYASGNLSQLLTRLGRTTENCFKLELMPRASYNSSGDNNDGAPMSNNLIVALLWIQCDSPNGAQLFVRNNNLVGFVSDTSYLFSAIVTNQLYPPKWGLASGEWADSGGGSN
ncbi:MAG: hypothetical protein ACLS9Z_10500 [Christensenellaceae bacterium]